MKLVLNSVASWAAVAASMLVGLVITPTLVGELGIEANGLWRLCVQIVGYYGLVDLALGAAVIRYLAKYLGEHRARAFRATFQTAVVIAAAFAVVLIVGILVFGDALADLLFDGEEADTFATLVRLLAVATGLNAVNAVFGAVFVAHEEIVLNSGLRFTSEIARMVASLAVLHSGGGLIGLGWVFVVLAASHLVVNVVITRRLHGVLVRPIVGFAGYAAGNLWRFGSAAGVSKIGDILRFQIDLVVLNAVVSLEAAGVYGVVLVLIRGFMNAVISVADTTQPRLAAIAKDMDHFRRSLLMYTNVVCLMIALLAATAYWLIEPVLQVWLPDDLSAENIDDAALVFRLLVIGMGVDMLMIVPTVGLRAINKHKYYAWQNVAEGIANLVLSLVLGARYGIVGVALGTTIPSLVTKLLVQPVYASHLFGVSRRALLAAALRPATVVVGVMGLTWAFAAPIPSGYLGLVLLAVPATLVVAAAVLAVGTTERARYAVRNLVRERVAQSA